MEYYQTDVYENVRFSTFIPNTGHLKYEGNEVQYAEKTTNSEQVVVAPSTSCINYQQEYVDLKNAGNEVIFTDQNATANVEDKSINNSIKKKKIQDGIPKKRRQCRACGKTFKSKRGLIIHRKKQGTTGICRKFGDLSNKISTISTFKERKEKTKLACPKKIKDTLLESEVAFQLKQGVKYSDLAKKLCINVIQSYVKEGLSIYKAIKETSKRVNVTVPTLYTFLKEFGAHGDLVSAPRTRDSKDFFDKLTDYQRDMIRNIMHNELRKSSVEKKLTNKKRIFSLINVHNVISQKTDLPTMSKSTLWKIVHCLGFKYNYSKEGNTDEGTWEITGDVDTRKNYTAENMTERIAEEISESKSEDQASIQKIKERISLKPPKPEKLSSSSGSSNKVGTKIKKKLVKTVVDKKQLTCNICGFVAKSSSAYANHYKSHKNCDLCEKQFVGRNAQRALDRHKKKCGADNVTKNKPIYQCAVCQKKFDFKSYWNRHIEQSKCRLQAQKSEDVANSEALSNEGKKNSKEGGEEEEKSRENEEQMLKVVVTESPKLLDTNTTDGNEQKSDDTFDNS